MATKKITDTQVIRAYIQSNAEPFRFNGEENPLFRYPYQILQEWTGESEEVCYNAMIKAFTKGYIEYSVSLRTGWVTPEGIDLLTRELAKK